MSLPSRAIVRSQNGEVIAEPFINCGWRVNSISLADAFLSPLPSSDEFDMKELNEGDTVEMYGEVLSVGFLRSMKDQEQLQRYFELKWTAERAIKERKISDA